MDGTALLVTLLVVGAPVALFFAMRRHPGGASKAPQAPAHDRKPPVDFGMAREASDPAPGRAEGDATSSAVASGAAAAAAGGAFILATAAGRHHASEGGGESPQAQSHGPDGGGGAEGGGEGGGGDL